MKLAFLWELIGNAKRGNSSEEMKAYFEGLHPNIRVIRSGTSDLVMNLWSHHQKFLVADQRIGIVG